MNAFGPPARRSASRRCAPSRPPAEQLALTWRHDGHEARLEADLAAYALTIAAVDETGERTARIDFSGLALESG